MSTIIGAETTAKVETQPRGKMIAYWSVTLLLAAAVMLSGIGQLMQYGGNARVSDEYWLPIIRLDHSRDLESAWSHRSRRARFSSA